MSVRTRIAPSPTGSPHIGTIFQALIDYVLARQSDGSFLVRIEDTDQARKIDGAEEEILSYLSYYGLQPDEGPGIGGAYGPYRQSERLEIYAEHAQQLLDAGHAYHCFCSAERLAAVRQSMQNEGKPPMYDKHCRTLDPEEAATRAMSEPHVVRMKVPEGETISFVDAIRGEITFESSVVDDQVLMKSDGYPTYHLAVVVDDHLMEITHTVRGEEWISSAPKHVLLYRYFGWDMPVFIHTPLLRNPDRSKLSKRHSHTAASWYKDKGYLPEAVINFLASRVWNHPNEVEVYGLDEIVKHFSVETMHIQGPIVDLNKLNWLNGQWIRSLDDDALLERLEPFLDHAIEREHLNAILALVKDRLVVLSDIQGLIHYFVSDPTVPEDLLLKQSRMDASATKTYLKQVVAVLDRQNAWEGVVLETTLRELQESLGLKPKHAFMTIRVALTGETKTPPLFDVMEVLGKDVCIDRLSALAQ